MLVEPGTCNLLLQAESQKFLAEQWPGIYATMQRLGLRPKELLDVASSRLRPENAKEER